MYLSAIFAHGRKLAKIILILRRIIKIPPVTLRTSAGSHRAQFRKYTISHLTLNIVAMPQSKPSKVVKPQGRSRRKMKKDLNALIKLHSQAQG